MILSGCYPPEPTNSCVCVEPAQFAEPQYQGHRAKANDASSRAYVQVNNNNSPEPWMTELRYSYVAVRTTRLPITHLHGADRTGVKEQTGDTRDKIVEPKNDVLNVRVDIVRQNAVADVDAYVGVNNRCEGCASSII